ncbi:MAG: efflux RND transporter periplasmic adaptor subunit [Chryseotalea sp. WA131a]|nr:MAG: efflux RND transporter periplasmic adaptor subunit [Chryseotalea sp. WA131a]
MKINIFSLVILVASCKGGSEKTKPTIEAISESVYASGVVKSKNQYQVYSTVNGLIEEIFVTEGDSVKIGTPLMSVVNEPSRLNAQNAKLAADYADLHTNADKLKEAKIAIDLAFSKKENDSLLLFRQENLWAQNVGTLVELEQRKLTYKTSKTNYETAYLSYRNLIKQLEFTASQSKTNLKITNAIAGDYIIKSEVNGKVFKILKEKGEFTNTINPVAVVGDATDFLIELKVDEYDVARIRENQKILLTMDSYKGKVFQAKVATIEPLMNEQSRSFTVNSIFITKPSVLYPNLSVEANIVIQSKEKAMTIPRSYLMGDSLVLVNKNEKRKVVIGLKDYQKVEIKSGLKASDVIYKPAL